MACEPLSPLEPPRTPLGVAEPGEEGMEAAGEGVGLLPAAVGACEHHGGDRGRNGCSLDPWSRWLLVGGGLPRLRRVASIGLVAGWPGAGELEQAQFEPVRSLELEQLVELELSHQLASMPVGSHQLLEGPAGSLQLVFEPPESHWWLFVPLESAQLVLAESGPG